MLILTEVEHHPAVFPPGENHCYYVKSYSLIYTKFIPLMIEFLMNCYVLKFFDSLRRWGFIWQKSKNILKTLLFCRRSFNGARYQKNCKTFFVICYVLQLFALSTDFCLVTLFLVVTHTKCMRDLCFISLRGASKSTPTPAVNI